MTLAKYVESKNRGKNEKEVPNGVLQKQISEGEEEIRGKRNKKIGFDLGSQKKTRQRWRLALPWGNGKRQKRNLLFRGRIKGESFSRKRQHQGLGGGDPGRGEGNPTTTDVTRITERGVIRRKKTDALSKTKERREDSITSQGPLHGKAVAR